MIVGTFQDETSKMKMLVIFYPLRFSEKKKDFKPFKSSVIILHCSVADSVFILQIS